MRFIGRWLVLVLVAALALELTFLGRIALMAVVDPQSTAFQRSEAWRLASRSLGLSPTEPTSNGKSSSKRTPPPSTDFRWRQEWVAYGQISDNLKRAVIASEDGSFVNHEGVDWEAMEKAWQKNEKAQERAIANASSANKPIKIVGGSTITQQLAKNLLLSGERSLLRKGQEIVLTFMLETLLSKQRILEIYLNSVEWGEGVFGAEAAAQHYYRKPAARLSSYEAARLAVMLPRPRYFEKLPNSGYLSHRASVIVARMPSAELP
ncbi:monofunctional biosynthetic peptidoglycan transglycosylase [Variovorax sp. HJSM1_2]|uniref:monofunctional biosynthetic peptidoglycan transglycosylase n=1 Tax=Variovorax sp. HJSM1_2 TaxID=3366263 RepID=UPI003BEA9C91